MLAGRSVPLSEIGKIWMLQYLSFSSDKKSISSVSGALSLSASVLASHFFDIFRQKAVNYIRVLKDPLDGIPSRRLELGET